MGQPQKPWDGKRERQILWDLSDDVIEYVDWYCENGVHLPEDFARDPSGWSQVLRYIQSVFIFIQDESFTLNKEEDEAYQKGLEYFYKYFKELWK